MVDAHAVIACHGMDQLSNARDAHILRVLPSMASLAAHLSFLARQFIDYEPGIHTPGPDVEWTTGITPVKFIHRSSRSMTRTQPGFYSSVGAGTGTGSDEHTQPEPMPVALQLKATVSSDNSIRSPSLNIRLLCKWHGRNFWSALATSQKQKPKRCFSGMGAGADRASDARVAARKPSCRYVARAWRGPRALQPRFATSWYGQASDGYHIEAFMK